jgi:hypothetical protein
VSGRVGHTLILPPFHTALMRRPLALLLVAAAALAALALAPPAPDAGAKDSAKAATLPDEDPEEAADSRKP